MRLRNGKKKKSGNGKSIPLTWYSRDRGNAARHEQSDVDHQDWIIQASGPTRRCL